jgi:hypothetical protein
MVGYLPGLDLSVDGYDWMGRTAGDCSLRKRRTVLDPVPPAALNFYPPGGHVEASSRDSTHGCELRSIRRPGFLSLVGVRLSWSAGLNVFEGGVIPVTASGVVLGEHGFRRLLP